MTAAEDTLDNEPKAGTTEKNVLPEPLNIFMACAWVVLFGGRWLLIPFVQMTGLLSPERVAAWDDGPLQKTYLILLSITCVVLALRAVRRAQSPRPLG